MVGPSSLDNCPLVSNPTQLDTNANGLGDACDRSGCHAACAVGCVARGSTPRTSELSCTSPNTAAGGAPDHCARCRTAAGKAYTFIEGAALGCARGTNAACTSASAPSPSASATPAPIACTLRLPLDANAQAAGDRDGDGVPDR